MFALTFFLLLLGFPVAFTLGGAALFFAMVGYFLGVFDLIFLAALPERVFGVMTNETLIAVPLFVFMGVMLERSRISEELLELMAGLFGRSRMGLGISVCIVGALLAASTGIVGATVVTMGLISLPAMLKRGYSPSLASGLVCASGSLGQIIPPSIILIILGDVVSSAHQEAQLSQGIFSPTTVSVGDLFVGAILPGLVLVVGYMVLLILIPFLKPSWISERVESQDLKGDERGANTLGGGSHSLGHLFGVLVAPLGLIVGVLGSILGGIATPTEAASIGCVGATLLASLKKKMSLSVLREVVQSTAKIHSMVFVILVGASLFSLVFRGFGGDEFVREILTGFKGGVWGSFFFVMFVMFLLGFFLDFFEITFVVIPIVGPVLLSMGLDPIWFGVMVALNLQTSFLTPPFGFALFYLRGVAPKEVSTAHIYIGAIPFILIQILVLLLVALVPELATWLPNQIFRGPS